MRVDVQVFLVDLRIGRGHDHIGAPGLAVVGRAVDIDAVAKRGCIRAGSTAGPGDGRVAADVGPGQVAGAGPGVARIGRIPHGLALVRTVGAGDDPAGVDRIDRDGGFGATMGRAADADLAGERGLAPLLLGLAAHQDDLEAAIVGHAHLSVQAAIDEVAVILAFEALQGAARVLRRTLRAHLRVGATQLDAEEGRDRVSGASLIVRQQGDIRGGQLVIAVIPRANQGERRIVDAGVDAAGGIDLVPGADRPGAENEAARGCQEERVMRCTRKRHGGGSGEPYRDLGRKAYATFTVSIVYARRPPPDPRTARATPPPRLPRGPAAGSAPPGGRPRSIPSPPAHRRCVRRTRSGQ